MGGGADNTTAASRFQAGRKLEPINLAAEAPIRVGLLTVAPALRQVIHDDGREQIIEPRMMQVLVALLRADGQILTRDDLLASCWGGVVVGEDAITRVIGSLRRLSEGIGADVFKLETITKVGFRLVASDARIQSSPETGIAAASPAPLLAVLAFDNFSGDPDVAYFSDGVSEEILQTVARGANLKVIGRASSFQFRGPEKAAGKVATALKATHILDGSVRRSGSRVRITAQLVECDGQTTLWSNSYEGDLANVFALQDGIASSVAAALAQVFTPPRGGRNIDPESYDLYLKSRALSVPSEVIAALERVTVRAPEFARAWSSLGGWLCAQARYWEPDRHNKEEMFRRAENAARRALALDPEVGSPHTVLADAEPMGAWSLRDAHLMRALDLSPDRPEVLQARAQYLACVGRVREAWEVAQRGYALDPLWEPVLWRRGILLWLTGAPEALQFSRERALREPSRPTVFANLWALTSVFAQDWASFAAIEKAPPGPDRDLHNVRRTLSWGRAVRDRDEAAADRMVRESEARLAAAGGLPFEDYLFLWRLGRVEAAFDLAARSAYEHYRDRTRDTLSPYLSDALFFVGAYRGFVDDPRIVGLFAKLGLCDYWLASDRWPDCADAVAYDFRAEARRLAASTKR